MRPLRGAGHTPCPDIERSFPSGWADRVAYNARPGPRPKRRNIRLDQPGEQLYCKEARVPLLTRIKGPRDLDRLSLEQLDQLAGEIRTFLVDAVSKTGGHLGPNLGVVELTIALHRVFDSPKDRVLFDTGHQSYVHKLLTGRQDFSRLKIKGGLSGYPSQAESEHDIIENSHASTVLGWADGLSKANEVLGRNDHVVAVIGDGALTGGMAWEALNNIADAKDRPLIIVVNDNERSYAPTIGGLANHLATLRTTDGYERFLARGKDLLERTPVVGKPLYETLHGAKKGLKDFIAPQGMFEDLGLKYVGPIDGHDIEALESALARAGVSAARSSCTASPRRAAATSPPSRTRRTASAPSHDPPRHGSRSPPPGRLDLLFGERWSSSARSARTSSRSPPRCSSRSASTGSPRPSPNGCTTSESPSSTPPSRQRAWPPADCTPSSPSTRPSSTAPSTRC